jgi:glycine/D-amino acid oxidase-like deaminating enzyme
VAGGAAGAKSSGRHGRLGTVSVTIALDGSNGKEVVTVFTARGRRIARHVVRQSGADSQDVVYSRFVLKPGRYKLKLTPRRFECVGQATVSVRARSTADASLGSCVY